MSIIIKQISFNNQPSFSVFFFLREIKVLTCIEEDVFPTRIKQFWVPVTMSGQVAALVESTQLLWQMKPDPQQVLSIHFFFFHFRLY